MPNDKTKDKNASDGKNRFVTRLKEYKEFIAILVFFMGGFFWIYGFFATKDQVKVLQCLTNNNIALIECRMQKRFLFAFHPSSLSKL